MYLINALRNFVRADKHLKGLITVTFMSLVGCLKMEKYYTPVIIAIKNEGRSTFMSLAGCLKTENYYTPVITYIKNEGRCILMFSL